MCTAGACWQSVGNGTYDAAWQLWQGNCYYFSRRAANWFGARDQCRRLNGDLVSLLREAENNFTRDMFPVYISHDRLWTGLNELEGLDFRYRVGRTPRRYCAYATDICVRRWSDGAPVVYDNWDVDNGQPNDAGGAELCVLMTSAGKKLHCV